MATYKITSPDGEAFEVNAPDDATEDQVMTYAKTQFSSMQKQPESQPTAEQKPKDRNWYDPIRAVLQGQTFGISDEIGAAAATIPAAIATGNSDLGGIYRDIHTDLETERNQYREDHFGESMALEAAGGLATGLATGAKVLGTKALQNAPKWLATAGVGAGEGALYGAGAAGEGDTIKGAAIGGAMGGVLAPVAGVVMNGAGKVLAPIAKSFKEHLTYTPKSQSMEVLRRVADDAGLTVEDIVEQYKKLGDDSILADADENFRGLLRALADRSGTAKREVRNTLEGRQMGSVDRLISKIQKTTGKDAGEYADTVQTIKAQRSAKAEPFYTESWGAEASQDMLEMVTSRPSVKAAYNRASRLAADEGIDLEGSAFKQFHYAKMALDDQIGTAIRGGKNTHARILITAKNDLVDAMDQAAPSYKQGRDLYAGDSELLNAATNGEKLLKMRPDEIDLLVSSMGSSERELFRHGAVKSIVNKLEDSQLTHDNAKKLVNSKSMQRKMGALFDSPDEVRDFVSQAIREREFGRTRQVVAMGSPTSQNTQMQKQLDDYAAQAFSFIDGAKGGVISAVISTLKGKPITPQTIDQAARVLLDKGLTEKQIRDIFVRSSIIEGAQTLAPSVGNAARGATVPVSSALYQE